MMEAAAAGIAFAQAAKELAKFARFAKSLGNIPEKYQDFIKELDDTAKLSSDVDKLVDHGVEEGESLRGVRQDLEGIVQTLRQLSEDVKRPPQPSSSAQPGNPIKISTIRWEKNKTKVGKLQESMRRTRGNLTRHLSIAGIKESSKRDHDTQQMIVDQTRGQDALNDNIVTGFSSVQISVQATAHMVSEIQGTLAQLVNTTRTHALPETDSTLHAPGTQSSSHLDQISEIHGPLPGPLSAYCDPYCSCHCHRVSASRPFYWVEPMLGRLQVRSNISPLYFFRHRSCNFPRCKAPSSITSFDYAPPAWFSHRRVQLQMSWGCLSGPGASLYLRVPQVVGPRIFDVLESRNLKMLEEILISERLAPASIDESGRSAVVCALHNGADPRILSLLVDTGFDCSIGDQLGVSGISEARQALRRQVNLNENETTVLKHIAYGNGAVEKIPVRLSKIHRALFDGNEGNDANLASTLKNCLREELDSLDEAGWAPIHYAVDLDQVQAVRLLLAAGADPDLISTDDKTPLTWAALSYHCSPEILHVLLESGADPNTRDAFGQTAILYTLGQPAKLRMLLDANVDAIIHAADVETPLHTFWPSYIGSSSKYSEEAIEESILMFLKAGVSIDHQDAKGNTPLMMALWRCDDKTIRCLLGLGARTDLVDNDGWNIWHYAAYFRDADIIDILRSANISHVDPHHTNHNGNRPYGVSQGPLPPWAVTISADAFTSFCLEMGETNGYPAPEDDQSTEAEVDSGNDSANEFFDATDEPTLLHPQPNQRYGLSLRQSYT